MWVWRAWRRLHTDRPWISGGMGGSIPGKIPLRDVLMYAELHDLSKDDAMFMDGCIGPMDDVFCRWQAESKS